MSVERVEEYFGVDPIGRKWATIRLERDGVEVAGLHVSVLVTDARPPVAAMALALSLWRSHIAGPAASRGGSA